MKTDRESALVESNRRRQLKVQLAEDGRRSGVEEQVASKEQAVGARQGDLKRKGDMKRTESKQRTESKIKQAKDVLTSAEQQRLDEGSVALSLLQYCSSSLYHIR